MEKHEHSIVNKNGHTTIHSVLDLSVEHQIPHEAESPHTTPSRPGGHFAEVVLYLANRAFVDISHYAHGMLSEMLHRIGLGEIPEEIVFDESDHRYK